ncbi:MAG: ATP-binding protein [Candidatus Omnitrophota bacterium]|jgi:tRNA 2-thiocytidine biosynthesis protein TtcA
MRPLSSVGNYISTRIGQAIADHKLIEDKDRILVAVSGGKDSLTMLKLMNERKKWAPVSYELIAMHVTSDYGGNAGAKKQLRKFFKENRVEYHFKNIRILDKERGVNCFWCSWNRRKALFSAADKLKCNKIALGHHKDDIVETLLLNMLYRGEFAAMNPRQELFGGKLAIIRPLCYVEEDNIRRFAKESDFPVVTCRCPNAEISKRRKMKDFIRKMEKDCKNVKTNIFNSISRVREDYIKI